MLFFFCCSDCQWRCCSCLNPCYVLNSTFTRVRVYLPLFQGTSYHLMLVAWANPFTSWHCIHSCHNGFSQASYFKSNRPWKAIIKPCILKKLWLECGLVFQIHLLLVVASIPIKHSIWKKKVYTGHSISYQPELPTLAKPQESGFQISWLLVDGRRIGIPFRSMSQQLVTTF